MHRAGGRHRVVALLAGEVSPFELGVVYEVFGLERPEFDFPWYRFRVAAADMGTLRSNGGFELHAAYDLGELSRADTIVIPAWHDVTRTPSPALVKALRAAHRRGARLISLCSGAFLLAATGLLDGRKATTHWMHTDLLARLHPKVQVDPNVLYIDDGNILTSAGTAAGIDLCLHVVRKDFGTKIANAVARRMVVAPHRDGGQAQFIALPVAAVDDQPFGGILERLAHDINDDLSVPEMARRAQLSTRTFVRRFVAATGTTPHRWLTAQRVVAAQRLLETSDLEVEAIAARTGVGTAASLRAHFRRALGTTPLAYRRAFRRKRHARRWHESRVN